MKTKAPAFQFYAESFLGGTAIMEAAEVGMYIRLLCHQWHLGGLPNDDRKLLQLAGGNMESLKEVKKKFFIDANDGLLKNKRLEQTRAEQDAYRNSQSNNGKLGNEKRWGKNEQKAKISHRDDLGNRQTVAGGIAENRSLSLSLPVPLIVPPSLTSENTNNTVIQNTSAEARENLKTEEKVNPNNPAEEGKTNLSEEKIPPEKTAQSEPPSTGRDSGSKEKNVPPKKETIPPPPGAEGSDKQKTAAPKQTITLPWDNEDFAAAWQKWKDWKRHQYRFTFKTTVSELAQLKHLQQLSHDNPKQAIAIIERSIGNGWKGIFKINEHLNNKNNGTDQSDIPLWRRI